MMLVMSGDFFEFITQASHAGYAVNELEVAFFLVVQAGVVNNRVPNRFVYPARDVERPLCIIQSFRPRVLIKRPKNLARLTQDSRDAIVKNRLAVSNVVEKKSD